MTSKAPGAPIYCLPLLGITSCFVHLLSFVLSFNFYSDLICRLSIIRIYPSSSLSIMCGRYALGVVCSPSTPQDHQFNMTQRMNFVRRRLQEQGMPVDEAPEDDEIRETYNFAPGNIGAIYRADTPNYNVEAQHDKESALTDTTEPASQDGGAHISYKLQGMKWGLVPFWTKRQPDYGSLMRTINCRDDSLIEDRGMWTSMKRKKRCVVVCQGYYEWLKRGPGGKEKIPHYTRRKDEDLMYLAGLWDSVTYEGKHNSGSVSCALPLLK